MVPASHTPPTPNHRRPRRSATYHRFAAASRKMGFFGAGLSTVLPTRPSLLRRALRSIGCAT